MAVDEVALFLDSRARMEQRPDEPSDQANPPLGAALRVREETSMRAGIRVVVASPPNADLDEIERWVRDVWPVTVDADLQLPEPVGDLLRRWAEACRQDPSGLDRLESLVATPRDG